MRENVKSVRGFHEVTEQVALDHPLIRQISALEGSRRPDPRQLKQNPVVKHLIGHPNPLLWRRRRRLRQPPATSAFAVDPAGSRRYPPTSSQVAAAIVASAAPERLRPLRTAGHRQEPDHRKYDHELPRPTRSSPSSSRVAREDRGARSRPPANGTRRPRRLLPRKSTPPRLKSRSSSSSSPRPAATSKNPRRKRTGRRATTNLKKKP